MSNAGPLKIIGRRYDEYPTKTELAIPHAKHAESIHTTYDINVDHLGIMSS